MVSLQMPSMFEALPPTCMGRDEDGILNLTENQQYFTCCLI